MKILFFLLSLAYANSFNIATDDPVKEKIVGGSRVNITEVPYQASFEYGKRLDCGAAIISRFWLISAAHCFINKPQLYRLGKIRIGTSLATIAGSLFNINKVLVHPEYNSTDQDNDIALIQLESPITFNHRQAPIPIVKANHIPREGQVMIVSGFGKTGIDDPLSPFLKAAEVEIIADSTCEEAYRKLEPITNNMFCGESESTDACLGDSGGPGVINGELAGIISSGYECASGIYPGVYTKVHKYYNWIVESTGIDV